jgi:hypothetical protein
MTVQKLKDLGSLKRRADKMGLILRQDRESRAFSLTVRGRAGTLFQGMDLKGVDTFLNRRAK